ncbi:hypothetical protein Tco_0409697 [Tanacetum coccineum]
MISDAIKKKAGYKYYMAKKVESEKAKIIDEPEEQHISPIKSGRGKGFMCYGDQVANVSNKLKKDDVPRKTISLTIAEEAVICELAKSISIQEPRSQRPRRSQLTIDIPTDDAVADMYNEWGHKLKGPAVEDPAQPVTGEGSSAAQNKYYSTSYIASDATLYSSSSDELEESANETDDADKSNMDLSNDNPHGDDNATRYGVFMHNKSTATPNSTYLSLTVTSSSLDFIQTLLDETPANELTDFMSHPVCSSNKNFNVGNSPDENAHHIPSLPAKKIPYPITTPQPNSLQAKAKKLMQKAKKNMRKINFKKAVAHKFREYDQKLEALTNFNNKKKRRKDVGEPSSRSSRQNRSLVVIVQDDTPALQPLDQANILIQKHSKPEWFPKKSGLAKRRMTWFDLFLKSDIDKDENHILGSSTVAITKKFKELIQKDEFLIADLEGAELERLKVQYNNYVELEYHVSQLKEVVLSEAQWNNYERDVSKPISFERHVSKSTKPHPCFYNNDYTYLMDLSTEEKYTTSITKHYAARYYKEEDRIDFFKAGMSAVTKGNVYSNLRIKLVVRIVVKKKWGYGFLTSIVVRRSDDKEYEYNYEDLLRLSVNDVEDMYLLQENLIDMVSKNKLGSGNKRLKGRDLTDYDVKSSRETLKKIDEVLKHREQLRRLEEYVGGRPETVNPHTFVRPL